MDASDRYRYDVVDKSSEMAKQDANGKPTNTVIRDDRKDATSEATALVQASAFGVLDGPVTVPRLTTYYHIGDRVASIDGRGLGLRTDDGTGSPIFPVVVGVRWEFGPDYQVTHVDISDAGSDRRRYMRRPRLRGRNRPPRGTTAGGVPISGEGGGRGPASAPSAGERPAGLTGRPVGIPEGQHGYEGG